MPGSDFDWLSLLKLLGSAGSAFGGMGGGLGGLGLPDAGAVTGATTMMTPPPIEPMSMPSAASFVPDPGTFAPPVYTPQAVRPSMAPPAALPTSDALPLPPIPPSEGAPPLSSALGPPTTRVPRAGQPFESGAWDEATGKFAPRSWWERNVGDPLDKAFTTDPKTGTSPGMKALQGMGTIAGQLGASGGAAAPAPPAGLGGGGGYHPTSQINASQMQLQREQARQLLMQRAQLNAPWLKQRLGMGGLMG